MSFPFPVLSTYQTLEGSYSSLDPLGLYMIADRLGSKLAPGMRERMHRPRYLTAMAVGAIVCTDFDIDTLASDEISPPWQVFEWYVVSAFVKGFWGKEDVQMRNLPGSRKAVTAFKNGEPLRAANYLKTPTVFGFHGVYRTLARKIGLLDDAGPADFAYHLVDVWEKEQGLSGFRLKQGDSSGIKWRKRLVDSVREGLAQGKVVNSWQWPHFDELAQLFAPGKAGRGEARLLLEQLRADDTGMRNVLIDFVSGRLDSPQDLSELQFHEALLNVPGPHHDLVKAIIAYEKVARLLQNAFYDLLRTAEHNQGVGHLSRYRALDTVKEAHAQLIHCCDIAERLLSPFPSEQTAFITQFASFRETVNLEEWVHILLDHHARVQKEKPPAGKAPWLLETSASSWLLNTTQELPQAPGEGYVHQYRLNSIYSFLQDLKIAYA